MLKVLARPARRLVAAILLVAAGRSSRAASSPCTQGTGRRPPQRIDDRLRADLDEFRLARGRSRTPAELGGAPDFIAGQGYHTDSRIFAIAPRGAAW